MDDRPDADTLLRHLDKLIADVLVLYVPGARGDTDRELRQIRQVTSYRNVEALLRRATER